MRADLTAATLNTLAAHALVPRDFLWIVARDADTGAPVPWGAWSDLGTVTALVRDPSGGDPVSRQFEGLGALISVSRPAMVVGLEVQTVTVKLSQVSAAVDQIVRGHKLNRAPVELFRGFMDPVTMRLPEPALPVFRGFVDGVTITTPAAGGEGDVTLTCASHAQELTRESTDKRSDASQRARQAGDSFYQHVATVGGWKIPWGQSGT